MSVVFFDLGDTLATPVIAGNPPRLASLILLPYVRPILERLAGSGNRLGIISNTGDEHADHVCGLLNDVGILQFFENGLLIFSGDLPGLAPKPDPALFREALRRVHGASDIFFVGEDAKERGVALSEGFKAVPHPKLVQAVIEGSELTYAQITYEAPDQLIWSDLNDLPVVALRIVERPSPKLISIVPADYLPKVETKGFAIEPLGQLGLPEHTDLFIVRNDRGGRAGFASGEATTALLATDKVQLLQSDRIGHLLALDGGADIEAIHLPGAEHGHMLKLVASNAVLDGRLLGTDIHSDTWEADPSTTDAFDGIEGDALTGLIALLSGAAADGQQAPPLRSRHIVHPDNVRAIAFLEAKFRSIGAPLIVSRQQFGHRGKSLFNLEAVLPGQSQESVIIAAHLDSTAGNDAGYRPWADAAPGADDDGSGVATVLAVAECFVAKANQGWQGQRTVRFVLFNAEEEGLVGSQAYARMAYALGLPIAGVFQLDMIGFNPTSPGQWEAHAGSNVGANVEEASLQLARALQATEAIEADHLGPLQIYHSGSVEGDPAAGRSDHASFHDYGIAAIAVSTDFFAGPDAGSPQPHPNPAYHSASDTLVHPLPMAAVARSIGRAAWAICGMTRSTTLMANNDTTRWEDNAMPGIGRYDARPYARARSLPDPVAGGSSSAFDAIKRVAPAALTEFIDAGFESGSTDLGERAISFVQKMLPRSFDGSTGVSFVADPVVMRTSAGAAAVHLTQYVKGVPVFQTSRTVQFDISGIPTDAPGTTALVTPDLNVLPKLDVRDAIKAGAEWLKSQVSGVSVKDDFGQVATLPEIDVADWIPELKNQFQ